MIDINNPLLEKYYSVLNALGYLVYEGEEPDNVLDKLYIVISDVNSNDNSNKSSSETNSTIQVTVNGWELGYAPTMAVNTAAGVVINAINPTPPSTLSGLTGIGIITTKLQTDRTQRYGSIAGRKMISRILIFSHYIYIQN